MQLPRLPQAQTREEALLTSCDQPGRVQGRAGDSMAASECLARRCRFACGSTAWPSVWGGSGPRTWGGAQGLIWGPLPAALVSPAHGPPSHPWGLLFPCWSMAQPLLRCPLGPQTSGRMLAGGTSHPAGSGPSIRAGAPTSVWSEAGPSCPSGPVSGLLGKGASPQPLIPGAKPQPSLRRRFS